VEETAKLGGCWLESGLSRRVGHHRLISASERRVTTEPSSPLSPPPLRTVFALGATASASAVDWSECGPLTAAIAHPGSSATSAPPAQPEVDRDHCPNLRQAPIIALWFAILAACRGEHRAPAIAAGGDLPPRAVADPTGTLIFRSVRVIAHGAQWITRRQRRLRESV